MATIFPTKPLLVLVAALSLALPLTACQPVSLAASAVPLATAETTAQTAPRISAAALKARVDAGEAILLVDTRALPSWQQERVQGAINLPYGELDKGYAQLPKDRFVALYCT